MKVINRLGLGAMLMVLVFIGTQAAAFGWVETLICGMFAMSGFIMLIFGHES